MTIEKKKLYSYTEVTTSELADKVPTLQGGVNKVTTLQKIYNLFKNSFDSVYTTASAVASQISNALNGYATEVFVNSLLSAQISNALTGYATEGFVNSVLLTKLDLQSSEIVKIDASENTELSLTNCILSVTNIPSGTGNKEVKIILSDLVYDGLELLTLNVIYKGFDVELKSYSIYDGIDFLYLSIYLNVHANVTEPVLISLNKIN